MLSRAPLRRLGLASFAFAAVQFTFSAVFPTVLVEGAHWSVIDAGTVLSLALVVSIAARMLWGLLADHIPPRFVLAALGLVMSVATMASSSIDLTWPAAAVVGLAMLYGVSSSSWNGIAPADAVHQVPAAAVSEASAGLISLTFLGALAGPALFSLLAGLSAGFRIPFLVLAAAAAGPTLLFVAWSTRD